MKIKNSFKNLNRYGFSDVYNFDKDKLYDCILVDAPCSGSGSWGKDFYSKYKFSKVNDIKSFVDTQINIILDAYKFLSNDGVLIYSTCSLFYEENEYVIDHILNLNINIKLLKKIFINPLKTRSGGFFIAVLKKST